ncbi:ATP-dependent helicase [Candidatus Berkelbacteria bacterium]|nr:ATP-dependent helicase [Candidatus Berkelbacteria bacterium]
MARKKTQIEFLPLVIKPDLNDSLNEAQLEAVTHTEGPLLVVAGAGTGKTKTLTHRIAWLIEQKLAKPREILALTFTEKAAAEMETRVDQLLPYGYTDTAIATFHSFGDQFLREYALSLGLPPEFRVLGSDEQALFLAERFDEIDGLTALRPIGNPRKYIAAILKVISRAKDELVVPEQYFRVAETLEDQAITEEEQREAARQLDIARIYAAYEQFKDERGVIDFGDQILKLVLFLDANPQILKTLRTRFRYVLVDEFQDTNVAQYELVRRLVSPSQHLTVVGDDDQAIYKFRGAAVSNILRFRCDFPKAKTVVLTKNYRSTQAILDTAYTLIRNNDPDRLESKLGINKHLTGQTSGVPPDFHWYTHEADEIEALVAAIRERQKTLALSTMAILVRSNTLIAPIATALRQADIPFSTSTDRSFIHRPEIRGIIAFLKCLAYTDDSLAYMKLALSPYYQLSPEWVLPFNDAARRANRSFHDVLATNDSIAWTRLSPEGKEAMEALRDDLVRYRHLLGSKNPGEILYRFLNDRGILETELKTSGTQTTLLRETPEAERLVMVQNLAAVFEAIRGYIESGSDPFSLTFIDRLDEFLSHITPPTVSVEPDMDAIRIMTVHASKGLEFDTVFLPSMTADRFPARAKKEVLTLPDALIAETLPTGDEHLEEERRLAYVAMTRARHELILSGAERSGEGVRTKRISPFVVEAFELMTPLKPQPSHSKEGVLKQFATQQAPATPTLTLPVNDGILFLSPAMIECYQNDPYDFYWKYVLKAPSTPSRHFVYGNAIHSAIEAYYRRRIGGTTVTLEDILQRYSEAWKSEGFESRADENRQFEQGTATLQRFVERASAEPLPTLVEETFTLTVPRARLRGRMDAIFESQGEIRDFKTSNVKDQKDANERVKKNIPIRIYALAYRQRFGALPKQVSLDFVEVDFRASLTPDETMISSTEKLIQETIDGILAKSFAPNPNNIFADYE